MARGPERRAVDFANERYVRLYVRETTTFLRLGWEAQAIMPHVLRKLDRSGVLDLGDLSAADALALHLPKWPPEIVRAGVEALARAGVVEIGDGSLVWSKFLEGQEARQSDAQRQRDSRERRRADGLSGPGRLANRKAWRLGGEKLGIIYFVGTKDGEKVKIGFTEGSVLTRLRQLETSCGEALDLLVFFKGSLTEERELHLHFHEHRLDGEWFAQHPDLSAFIQEAVTRENGPVTCGDDEELSHAVTPAVPSRLAVPAVSSVGDSKRSVSSVASVRGNERTRLSAQEVERRKQLVLEIVQVTGDSTPRSLPFFKRVVDQVDEQIVRRWLSSAKQEGESPVRLFTSMASSELKRQRGDRAHG
jgi:hypothetical protein